jgi:hypothetical protein
MSACDVLGKFPVLIAVVYCKKPIEIVSPFRQFRLLAYTQGKMQKLIHFEMV